MKFCHTGVNVSVTWGGHGRGRDGNMWAGVGATSSHRNSGSNGGLWVVVGIMKTRVRLGRVKLPAGALRQTSSLRGGIALLWRQRPRALGGLCKQKKRGPFERHFLDFASSAAELIDLYLETNGGMGVCDGFASTNFFYEIVGGGRSGVGGLRFLGDSGKPCTGGSKHVRPRRREFLKVGRGVSRPGPRARPSWGTKDCGYIPSPLLWPPEVVACSGTKAVGEVFAGLESCSN